jgi:hypothetical protein
MAPVACPKCSVVVYQTASGGWRFEPPLSSRLIPCLADRRIRLSKGKLEQKRRHNLQKRVRDLAVKNFLFFNAVYDPRPLSPPNPSASRCKRKPRRSGASRATLKPSPRNRARGRVDLRRPRDRRLYKIDHFNEKPAGDASAPA